MVTLVGDEYRMVYTVVLEVSNIECIIATPCVCINDTKQLVSGWVLKFT